ncbi:MAG TPA: tetratricopeptide repeat protein [Fimbriimonadaceae bacterium]
MEDDAARPKPAVGQTVEEVIAQQRLAQLEKEAAALREQLSKEPAAAEPEPEPEPELPPPTHEQLAAADNFIRQARLARSRNQSAQASDFLKKAEQAVPNAPAVLEFIGDDLAERKQFKQAREMYQKALKLAPKNVALERKFAETILHTTALGNAALYSEFEVTSSRRAGTIFSAIIPGSGQIFSGEYVKGASMFIVWLVCIIWLLHDKDQFAGLFHIFGSKALSTDFSKNAFDGKLLIPLFIAFLVWIISIFDMKMGGGGGMGGMNAPKAPPTHPTPPANLPFE